MAQNSQLDDILANLEIHQEYDLDKIINARGVFTPLGVSRSPKEVANVVSYALQHYFDMKELQELANSALCRISGQQAGALTHCAAAGVTLSVAASMCGQDDKKVDQLPDTTGMPDQIVIQAGHLVNYGQPVSQAIRLAGADVIVAGSKNFCEPEQLTEALSGDRVAGLVYVDSRLCHGQMVGLNKAVELAHSLDKPVIVDAAAQDLRLDEVVQADADLYIFSAQKYLAGPTAGIVIGNRYLIDALRAQETGIGRTMKPSKEAIIGTLAALNCREKTDMDSWARKKQEITEKFSDSLAQIEGISSEVVEDPTGGPFSRVHCKFDEDRLGLSTSEIVDCLKSGRPPIYVFENLVKNKILVFEVLDLNNDELSTILSRLREAVKMYQASDF